MPGPTGIARSLSQSRADAGRRGRGRGGATTATLPPPCYRHIAAVLPPCCRHVTAMLPPTTLPAIVTAM